MEEANVEGVDYCGPTQTSHKGFPQRYVGKTNEVLTRRILYCYEEYCKSSCSYTYYGHRVQVQIFEGFIIHYYREGWKY